MPPFGWISSASASSSFVPTGVVTMPAVPKPASGVPPEP
jgi:hypothetical protein